MLLHPKQKEIARNRARFKVTRAGRKGGKTQLEVETIAYKALAHAVDLGILKHQFPTIRKVLYIAPTQDQARSIIWEALKTRLAGVGIANEQRLEMRVQNADGLESIIRVGGWENRENYRGLTDVVHITFDETDTLKDFFIAWKEIFRPMFLDTGGTADFVGTPKKENPNMKRLEKEFAALGDDFAGFHFTSADNPFLPRKELKALEREYEDDPVSFRQEILAEYVDNEGALFRYSSIVDIFTNVIQKRPDSRYLTIDISEEGGDKTIFTFWDDLEAYRVDVYEHMTTDQIISQVREDTARERIPMSHVAVDAIGPGYGVASSPLLAGCVAYKGSYAPIKTDQDIVRLPNVHYVKDAPLTSNFRNLRAQCIFALARAVNEHRLACTVGDVRIQSQIIDDLAAYQDASKGDGKAAVTSKEDMKKILGRSTDVSDTFVMRMYFEIRERLLPDQTPEARMRLDQQQTVFARNRKNQAGNSTR